MAQLRVPRKNNSRWQGPLQLFGLGLVLTLVIGCQKIDAKTAATPPPPPEVLIGTPIRKEVVEIEELSGRLMSMESVELRARVSGYLKDVLFKDGSDVVQGQPLFQIDARSFEADAAKSRAKVQQMEARLERLRKQELREKKLIDSKNSTQEQYELVRAERAETEAEVAAAVAELKLAELDVEYSRVVAPIAGRISRHLVDEGNLVRANETVLANLVTLDPLHAYFDIDERTVLKLRRLIAEGRLPSEQDLQFPVEIGLADEATYNYRGTINFVDNQLSMSTGTLRLRAVVQNPERFLSPGMYIRLRVPLGAPRAALLVREESLGSDQGQRFVYVVNANDEIEYRRVKIGMLDAGYRVIEEGLNENDRIVITGLQRVRPKSKVTPKPWQPPSS